MRTRKILSLTLPTNLLRVAERLARSEGRSKSQVFCDTLRFYVEEGKWRDLQRYGARRAKDLRIAEHDVNRAIGDYRKNR